jgi:hypothetical protein
MIADEKKYHHLTLQHPKTQINYLPEAYIFHFIKPRQQPEDPSNNHSLVFSDMTKLQNLIILAFILGYALIAQGTPIENEDGLEKVEVDPSTSVERGNRVRRGFDYKSHMQSALARWKSKYPDYPNIVIVWDGASYDTNRSKTGEEWMNGHRYLVYQWKYRGIREVFTLKSNGGWENWSYSGNYKRYDRPTYYVGQQLVFD